MHPHKLPTILYAYQHIHHLRQFNVTINRFFLQLKSVFDLCIGNGKGKEPYISLSGNVIHVQAIDIEIGVIIMIYVFR